MKYSRNACFNLKSKYVIKDIIDKYKNPLYSFILKMTEGKDDADDIFQEVWFKAIKNISSTNNNITFVTINYLPGA